MPDQLLPDEGIAQQLESILSAPIPGLLPWTLILWTNDVVPDANTVLADLVEATFPGYSRATLSRAAWTTPTVNSGCAHSTWGTDPILWFVTGPTDNTVYGYAMCDLILGVLRTVQRFDDADIQPLMPGQRIALLPEYTLTSAPCP